MATIEETLNRLEETEDMLRRSQRAARLGTYVLDIPSGVWKSSPLLDEIFGIGRDFPHTVEGWGQIVHPDMRQEMLGYFRNEVAGKGHRFDRTYMIVRPSDGETRWVQGFGDLEFDASGKPVRMIGTIQDITELRRAQEAEARAAELERITKIMTGRELKMAELKREIERLRHEKGA